MYFDHIRTFVNANYEYIRFTFLFIGDTAIL